MSQRPSGYERKERDLYETPEWVTQALLPHLPEPPMTIWEPAAGSSAMVTALRDANYEVVDTDIVRGWDFLKGPEKVADAIITNPPYRQAQEFIERALKLLETSRGLAAFLLRTDFDHAKTRRHLFGGCPQFAKKLALTRRIVWFERPGAAPSFNHAWFIWDWEHSGPPVIAYD